MKHYSETSSFVSKTISAKTKQLVEVVQKRVSRKQQWSMKQMAKSVDISQTAMYKDLSSTLQSVFYPYLLFSRYHWPDNKSSSSSC
ncbi:Hypothetical predicted protein [Octopus vulgaris]|uniref:Uncharacterized protein n=1 Tax=Octopus vulgaris TaxID=6645 RepID=A0AA36F131_OCTVU|nr:Hypothetical predicted protein [Octopus vulgaris]